MLDKPKDRNKINLIRYNHTQMKIKLTRSKEIFQGDEEKRRGMPATPYMDRSEPQVVFFPKLSLKSSKKAMTTLRTF